jgi:hypothetical protein
MAALLINSKRQSRGTQPSRVICIAGDRTAGPSLNRAASKLQPAGTDAADLKRLHALIASQ